MFQKYSRSDCDKLLQAQKKLGEVQDIMKRNLDDLLGRQFDLEVILKEAEEMNLHSSEYRHNAEVIEEEERKKNCGFKIIIVIVIILIVLALAWLISSFICGFDYSRCSSSKKLMQI